MQVANKKILIAEDAPIICPKCSIDITEHREDSFRSYNRWENKNDQTSAVAKEYVICPHCHKKVTLAILTEEF